MKRFIAVLATAMAGLAAAGPLLDFRDDLAFRAQAVDGFAARGYEQRLAALRSTDDLDHDPALLEKLITVFPRLLDAAAQERSDARDFPWEVHTCRRCGESASAMAGGRLLLSEEFLSHLAPTDDELAFLLAHEMAHALCEHTREFATAARYFVDNGLRREYWDIQRELDGSLIAQFRMAFVAAQQELEADRVGLIIGASAGFDPAAMPSLLERLEAPASSASSATHPARRSRLEQAAAMLQTARIVRFSSANAWDR